ncbi:MAG: chemotaxis protein CheW [Chloroflexi bacterium]|nr:chemotaxis protein CheW [Chloroflexota bacterium]MCI0889212.1 chemotaxis protein CheW [Chloroflexota bacterium]
MVDDAAEADEKIQFIVFRVGTESYGMDVSTVREVLRLQEVTYVPNAPEYVEGVINLRGKVAPIVDLRKRFGVEVSAATNESRIVVAEYNSEDVGMIVDSVTEVLSVNTDSIERNTGAAEQPGSALAQGYARLEDRLLIVVDVETVLGEKEGRTPPEELEAAA